jgi:hypothetical protein
VPGFSERTANSRTDQPTMTGDIDARIFTEISHSHIPNENANAAYRVGVNTRMFSVLCRHITTSSNRLGSVVALDGEESCELPPAWAASVTRLATAASLSNADLSACKPACTCDPNATDSAAIVSVLNQVRRADYSRKS